MPVPSLLREPFKADLQDYFLMGRSLVDALRHYAEKGNYTEALTATLQLDAGSRLMGARGVAEACEPVLKSLRSGVYYDLEEQVERVEKHFAIFRCSAEVMLRTTWPAS